MKSDPRVVAQALFDDMTTDMRPELSKISAPVTLLYAQDDRAMTPTVDRRFRAAICGDGKFQRSSSDGQLPFHHAGSAGKVRDEMTKFLAPPINPRLVLTVRNEVT